MTTAEDASSTTHADVPNEQRLIDHAYECLRHMRKHAEYLKSLGYQGGNIHADTGLTPEMAAADDARKQRRIDSLADPATALCFGRIDRRDGERFYIGRRHVQDTDGEPVVTDWRAPTAVPFYRATVADRMGLDGRRRFVIEGRTLLDIFEENLENPSETAGAYVPDPLLAEVERGRTGAMRDIVATIQGEQDAIIRAPLDQCIVVQGGPGTGKTAVGLHRAAFLLYEHREQLERERVLIIGPNPIFFRYISQVLPSLGETAAVQLTIDGLTAGRTRVRGDEPEPVARVKGDARMATVVRNTAIERLSTTFDDLVVATPFGSVSLPASEIQAITKTIMDSGRPFNDGRAVVRDQLVDLAWKSYLNKFGSDPTVWATFVDGVRASADFKKALDKVWPALTATDLVRRLYGNQRVLERATEGVLTPDERDLLRRTPARKASDEAWTAADAAIVDEAETLLGGTSRQYGHIVVDEAQDLSAMQLRLVSRRARRGSMTVLGDLAQAGAAGAQTDWAAAIDALGAPNPQFDELTIGYRVPAPILDLANRVLPLAAPGLRPTTSARMRGIPPRVIDARAGGLESIVAREARELVDRWTSTAIIVPPADHAAVVSALFAAGLEFTDGNRTTELGDHLTVLPPAMAKGLEFDAVIVAEPAAMVAGHPHGIRLLYVALTRAVQELVIVHADALPAVLVAPAGAQGSGFATPEG